MNTKSYWKPLFEKLGAETVSYTIETGRWTQKAGKDFFDNG